MERCAYLVQVVIGELTLAEPHIQAHHIHHPLCPIIAVQVCSGPIVYVPFLDGKSIREHFHDVSHGHQSLPGKVEDSYRQGGHFIFQQGRSCLFSSREVVSSDIVNNKDSNTLPNPLGVDIVALNGFRHPPLVFGKYQGHLAPIDCLHEEWLLRSRVSLRNRSGKLVARVTLNISCRALGEDVACHLSEHCEGATTDRGVLSAVPFLPMKYEDINTRCKGNVYKSSSNEKGYLVEKSCDIKKSSIISANKTEGTVTSSKLQLSSMLSLYPQDLKYRNDERQSVSLDLVKKIKDCKSNRERDRDRKRRISTTGIVSSTVNSISAVSRGDKESDTKALLRQNVNNKTVDYNSSYDPSQSLMVSTSVPTPLEDVTKSIMQYFSDECSDDAIPFFNRKKYSDKSSVIQSEKNDKMSGSLHNPRGWLRTTPVASCYRRRSAPQPRLTRTTLLRKAKVDPELGLQLQKEVEYRLKHKLKVLDEHFKMNIANIPKRKPKRPQVTNKTSVSCQTSKSMEKENENGFSQTMQIIHKDFMQQTDNTLEKKNDSPKSKPNLKNCMQQTDNYYPTKSYQVKQMGETYTVRKKSSSSADSVSERESEDKSNLSIGKVSNAGLTRGQTYDLDTENKVIISTYEDDFEVMSISECSVESGNIVRANFSENEDPQTSIIHNRSPNDSAAVTACEPKQQKWERKTTNKIRDEKMVSNSRYNMRLQEENTSDQSEQDCLVQEASGESESDVPDASNIQSSNPSYSSSNFGSEVSEASNLSVEVFQEILKGKHADLLMRNGSQLQIPVYESSAVDDSSPLYSVHRYGVQARLSQESQRSQKMHQSIHNSIMNLENATHRNDTIKLNGSSREERYDFQMKEESQSNREKAYQSPHEDDHPNQNGMETDRDLNDEESSISNISARIANLLMPRRVSVASVHTDSVSSYVPSDMNDSLSSLSDMS